MPALQLKWYKLDRMPCCICEISHCLRILGHVGVSKSSLADLIIRTFINGIYRHGDRNFCLDWVKQEIVLLLGYTHRFEHDRENLVWPPDKKDSRQFVTWDRSAPWFARSSTT